MERKERKEGTNVNVTFVVLEVGESGGVTEEGSEGEPSCRKTEEKKREVSSTLILRLPFAFVRSSNEAYEDEKEEK